MNQFQSRAELKNTAKDILTGKYSLSILIFLLKSTLTMFFLSLILSLDLQLTSLITAFTHTADNPMASIVSQLIALLSSILFNIFNVGVCLFFLNAACGRPFSAANLFYGFQQDFGKSFCISAVTVLLNQICTCPADIMIYFYQKNGSLDTLLLSKLLLASVIGLIIYTPISLGLSQCYFLMLDFPQYSAGKIIKLSFQIMKGQKLRLFCLQLSFLPLMLLCVASFGIGMLWLLPYMNMVYALFFLDLMKKQLH